jgi:dihydrofolate synthase/folylpolyglutamate synthase
VVTALALDYFHHQDVTFAVIETGLGGRLDATNIIEPAVSIITNITYEHNEILGNTLEKITGEKAGIIKQAPVITAAVEPALSVIKKVASQRGASVIVIGEDVTWQSITPHHFCISTKKKYDVTTGMIGEFQGENIALALAASEHLNISKKAILKGIKKTKPPGRMEIISHDPLILLDGAHNPAAMEKLKNTLVQNFHFHHLIFVLGILKDKDIPNMISHLIDIGDYFIVTTSSNPRSCPPNILTKILQKEIAKQQILITNKNLSCALKTAMNLAKTNDLICVTGSLFTVGEARNFFAHIFK